MPGVLGVVRRSPQSVLMVHRSIAIGVTPTTALGLRVIDNGSFNTEPWVEGHGSQVVMAGTCVGVFCVRAPLALNIHGVEELVLVKMLEAQSSPFGVAWKLGEGGARLSIVLVT
ncbi:hypothetical protein TNCV_4270431 [Trichonephila clavipes]|nr:hypothetical protein TNCV_4270431 [Trichonephila clavipes]